MENRPYTISFHGFWPRFFEDEQNNIGFFRELFSLFPRDLVLVQDASASDILVNSLHGKQEKREGKLNILFAPEPHYPKEGWELVLGGVDESLYPNAINVPLLVSYLYCNNFYPRLINRPMRTTIPPKFCCWIVSNPTSNDRNLIFHILCSYKKVESVGRAFNNMGFLLSSDWGSPGFFEFISQYKFVICAENTKIDQYITEKIFHGYLAHTIPIYYGTDYAKQIFEPTSFINLESATEEGYTKLLQKVIEVDNDDQKWLAMANAPVFHNNRLIEELQMPTLKRRVAERMTQLLTKE